METVFKFSKEQIQAERGSVFYKEKYYDVADFCEEEQLFMIKVDGQLKWVRSENCSYIPF